MFTSKEKKILKFLMTSFSDYSINQIAKECKITPKGAYKILKKLEKEQVVSYKEISNIKAYKIDFENPLTLSYLEIALRDERINQPKIKAVNFDLEQRMKPICKICALFGSYITDKKSPNDIDILFVFEQENLKVFKKKLEDLKSINYYKIHDVIQTEQEIIDNLKEKDKIIINVIRNGVILWGHELIARSVKTVQTQGKTG